MVGILLLVMFILFRFVSWKLCIRLSRQQIINFNSQYRTVCLSKYSHCCFESCFKLCEEHTDLSRLSIWSDITDNDWSYKVEFSPISNRIFHEIKSRPFKYTYNNSLNFLKIYCALEVCFINIKKEYHTLHFYTSITTVL